jgi:hypothetical protein
MQGGLIPQMAAIAWYSPKLTEIDRMSLDAQKRGRGGPLSASISEYQPAFSLLSSPLSREEPRIAAAQPLGLLFFRCI